MEEENKLYEETKLLLTKQYSGPFGEINFKTNFSEFLTKYIQKDNELFNFYKIWHERFMKRPDGFYTLLNFIIDIKQTET